MAPDDNTLKTLEATTAAFLNTVDRFAVTGQGGDST